MSLAVVKKVNITEERILRFYVGRVPDNLGSDVRVFMLKYMVSDAELIKSNYPQIYAHTTQEP